MTIGDRIKSIRVAKKMTQKEMATKLGVTQSLIGQYERSMRYPKTKQQKQIAAILDAPIGYIAGDPPFDNMDIILNYRTILIEQMVESVETEPLNKTSLIESLSDYINAVAQYISKIKMNEDGTVAVSYSLDAIIPSEPINYKINLDRNGNMLFEIYELLDNDGKDELLQYAQRLRDSKELQDLRRLKKQGIDDAETEVK